MHNLLLENCFFTKADITFSKTTYTIKVSHLGSYYLNFADLDVKIPKMISRTVSLTFSCIIKQVEKLVIS